MANKERLEFNRRLQTCIPYGISMGAGIGISMQNIAVGVAVGFCVGVILARGKRR